MGMATKSSRALYHRQVGRDGRFASRDHLFAAMKVQNPDFSKVRRD